MEEAKDFTIEYENQGIRILRRIINIPEIDYIEDFGHYLGVWDTGVAAQWVYMKINEEVYQKLMDTNFEPEYFTKIVNGLARRRFTLDGEPKKKVDGDTQQTIHR